MSSRVARAPLVLSLLVGCAVPHVPSAANESKPAASSGAPDEPPAAPSHSSESGSNATGVPSPANDPVSAEPGGPSASVAVAPAAAPEATASDSLHDAQGTPLPQTEDRPRADSPAFLRRMELLVRAIEVGDAALAHDAFFPVVAYEQVKDIAKPAIDHERRLLAAFARNVREYRRELGENARGIRFVRVEVPEDKVKWMNVGKEGNRVGYFRVLRSRLVVATAEGKERSFELTSMISWRGEWYVVHLHGFK